VVILGRAGARAAQAAARLRCASAPLVPAALEQLVPAADVIVAAVSTPGRIVPRGLLRPGTVVLDAFYASQTALSKDALERGCRVVDGREWLLQQGLESFRLFTGRRAPVRALRRGLAAMKRRPRSVTLIGYTGVGKSTVAGIVARRGGLRLVDTDAELEAKSGLTAGDLLRQVGEPAFRTREAAVVEGTRGLSGAIVAAGGGAILKPANLAALRERSLLVWLWASLPTCLRRIEDPATRPLLKGPRVAARLFADRLRAYAMACDVVVDTEGRTPEEVAERVLALLDEVDGR